MKIHKGTIEGNDLEFDLAYIGYTLTIEQILFVMKAMSPDFIQINDNIYLLSHFKGYGENEENRFDNTPQGREKYINNLSISDVFYFSEDIKSHEPEAQKKIGLYVLEFWKMRLNYLFPDKDFDFTLSENGLFDESGVCITFCQSV
ncbi:hypothetical protein [Chryseobacterium sp. BIGb0232]|uniref:hypothetical protein n=1 Tax=Chryseobacterium sp. BIGb0232 TaxID=2940598 RepID=UPI000F470078|nr:hypothetical protein [Chryseobacterium sp. BIGb0232]MCS4303072.1 hypothetical protein [Chryseobacterium sp. BIGb0232]ROS14641.1 hypothetical protein EDF65_3417 [Chryseobacterium nakagawai]